MGKSKPANMANVGHCNVEDALEQLTQQNHEIISEKPITSGKFFEALRDIYVRYCDIASQLQNADKKIVAFSVDYETRQTNGLWSTHPCYKVHFSDKEILPFSTKHTGIFSQ
ncbi:hypothetical protein [Pseudoalteromonas luteoviolacea]|uniref:Uncharacterized protein n=1 Tax=Pseudoalteromonas luteoviolacea H33 TaxID=1365251 RepID=A0A161Y1W3_9GAMM|nr:hypothetical protein [Pseudoalteromonas luteoviolacea]KZN50045.1 hypothetical protein N476_17000 [Pseudoalteromonas luteoviolacea H33]KZN76381.1 hypothetical protein N477_16885 [Pseudoalteromonas luteoviolacea H33-S]MBQ4877775.1 hypothetical protein [Pseudoalteromonas luteoviolacea]MBQ4906779.1 hypothetical protein [Pseudoalteromonas luteoviolacea]